MSLILASLGTGLPHEGVEVTSEDISRRREYYSSDSVSNFSRNVSHLIGLHLLTGRAAQEHLGLSAQAISELKAGKRQPSLSTLQKLSAFFEISIDRLLEAEFEDLLANELADPDRFRRVEAKIGRGKARLRPV